MFEMNPFWVPDEILAKTLTPTVGGVNASLEAIQYDQFFQRRGIRSVERMTQPLTFNAEAFELPQNALMHYVPLSETELGPAPTHLFLRKAQSQILIEHAVELAEKEGNPIRTMENAVVLGNRYKGMYRRIRPLRDLLVGNRDPRTVLIENYGLLNHLYRYRPTPFTRLNHFTNLFSTLLVQINRIAELTDRHQFIELRLPQVVPARPQFVAAAKSMTRTTMTFFPNDDSLVLLELWKWLGKDRESGLMAKLSPAAVAKLNFVIVEHGQFTVFNLGRLEQWRKVKAADGTFTAGIMPEQLQLRFAKFLEAMFVLRTTGPKTVIEQQFDANDPDAPAQTTAVVSEGQELEEIELMELEAERIKDIPDVIIPVVSEVVVEPEPRADSEDMQYVQPMLDTTQELRSAGLLSSAEERRLLKLANSYTTIPNPVGAGTLADLIKVDQAVVTAPLEQQITDIPLVVDKSMLSTTLNDFDSRYIEQVMHADIAGMLMQAQLVGVAITGYTVEKVEDAGSAYEIHTVRLTPASGAPSTFRFRIPVIESDGSFMANGVKLRLRKQRGDQKTGRRGLVIDH